jgi:cyclophilin family peptidyl-prolyl cis-trans isomerase
MTAEKIESERRRSRPVEKPKKIAIVKRNKAMFGIILVVIAMVIIAALAAVYVHPGKNSNVVSGNRFAVIDTTMGSIKVELYEDKMPITTANFIKLANDGFYDGMIFHRIGKNFMIQTGGYSPDGTQKSSPYGNIPFETSDVKHVDGAISMASTGAKVGGSAEFFICDGTQTFLDGNYAAFGVTIEGLDVVKTIAAQPHPDSGDGTGKPTTDIIINSITIVSS